ncbi:hypothetical protein FB45DRAFT_906148 [Roridomyces roridus]|uniref:Uncharacterized protein n=1 Tax=Roridomyces roridus TaxID=1738132 RepID=A0AAD7C2K2_9AGAR|nr:hypothetical protein FB45DRAFT_906148 [Roridomyces roridus]
MQLLTTLIASFVALAAANPVASNPRSCQILPFLSCEGGIDQQLACQALPWSCPSNGATPVISDATCAAQCVCEIPCP